MDPAIRRGRSKRAERERAGLNKTQLCRYHARGRCRFGEKCAFAHNLSELCGGKKGWDAPNADLSRLKHCASRGVLPGASDLIWKYLTPFFAELPSILRDQYKNLTNSDITLSAADTPNRDDASWRELAQALTGYPWAVTLFCWQVRLAALSRTSYSLFCSNMCLSHDQDHAPQVARKPSRVILFLLRI